MNRYTQAVSPEDDSIEYILLNFSHGLLVCDRTVKISYYRGDDNQSAERFITFESLDALRPGLSAAIREVVADLEVSGTYISNMVGSIAAYVFGSYTTLQEDETGPREYPYASRVFSVKSNSCPGMFDLGSVCFKVTSVDTQGIPKVIIYPEPFQLVSSADLDAIWANGSKQVSMLENLDYDAYELVAFLDTNAVSIQARQALEPTGVRFDI